MTDWLGKPYYSLDAYLKKTFGEKVYKLSLDGGMTCPNRDGTCGDRGCIFCSAGGSGDFAGDRNKSIPEQIREQKSLLQQKRPVHKFIAYFQAYTNTYAPVEYLEKIFREAISDEEVVVLSIGTRPDCLGEEVLSLLEELNRIKPVWVELGLQTMHEKTAQYIRRGYPLSCFEQAVNELHRRGIPVIVHTILGLPGEGQEEVFATMDYLNGLSISGIKLQLLHVLKNTDLAADYAAGKFEVLEQDAAGGQFAITAAYTHAPAREISVYDYSQLIFTTILGYFLFGDIPDGWSFLGYFIIIAMAVLVFLYNNVWHNDSEVKN